MSTPIADYALLADMRTTALVSRGGSIDWLCLPRMDSPAVFCALLGTPDHGRWGLTIADGHVVERRYRGDSFVLETTWESPTGTARVLDLLPSGAEEVDLMRVVECTAGEIVVEQDLRLRLNYGRVVPWIRREPQGLVVMAGPVGILLTGPDLDPECGPHGAHRPCLTSRTPLREGGQLDWQMLWFPSHHDLPQPSHPTAAIGATQHFWAQWSDDLRIRGRYAQQVRRSLQVLRALTNSATGGIVAAPTTSLPEKFGGERNWDYRFTWLRDASFTIEVLVEHGSADKAVHWRNWLLRAVAGDVSQLQIMYGIAGERDLPEAELDHLPGYAESRPVRIGNAAVDQYQADVVGEVMLALGRMRDHGHSEDAWSWGLQRQLLHYCETHFDRPDHGIWEMRGDPHKFTHGRAMMWAAFNQGIRAVEHHGLEGPVDRWRELRERLQTEIDDHGFDSASNSFTQTYDNTEVDASLLQLPHTGFCAYDDPRMLGTVARIEAELGDGSGLLHRYRTAAGLDGLPGDEYPFLICSFWLVEQYACSGRLDDAIELMDRLVGLANDVGLLSEEYDPAGDRLAGNFPQAFSHLALVRASAAILDAE
ncbi:MAG TPA: glycoside hydrolase family 15 protein [Propionibacterium sp.]|jgi:GH15 family glucan-1,4-alpha-glucosidase|nr:glycoside hydrolase family 15 protein [Propionibacterium sp.]